MFVNTLKELLEFSYCLIDVFLIYEFSKIFKLEVKVTANILYLSSFVTALFFYIIGLIFFNTSYNELLLLCISVIYFVVIFRLKKISMIILPLLFQIIIGIVTIFVSYLFVSFANKNILDLSFEIIPRTFVAIIIKSLMFFMIQFALQFIKNIHLPECNTNNILIFIGANFFVLLLAFEVLFLENKLLTESFLRVFFAVFSVSFIVMLFLIIRYYQNRRELEAYNELVIEYKYKQENFNNLIENQLTILKLKHDMRNHLLSIRLLVNNSEYSEAISYINDIEKLSPLKTYINTSSEILNAILNSKINEFPNIKFKVEFNFKDLNIRMIDLTTLLGNLLDNAIDAVNRLDNSKQIIYIFISENDQFYKIKIKNEFDGYLNYGNNKLLSRKRRKQSGLGLENIEDIVKIYNGEIKIDTSNNMFETIILLMK